MKKFIFIILLIPSILFAQSYQEGLHTYAKSKKVSKKKKAKPKKSESANNNLIGLQGHYLSNGTPAGKANAVAAGGGFQFEPDFLHISDSFRMGYILEYTRSTGDADYKMVNNILYLQYRYMMSDFLDFYGSLGTGVSYIDFKRRDQKSDGANTIFMSEIGWQGLKFGNFVMRVGLRGNAIVERYTTYGYGGLQISFLMNF